MILKNSNLSIKQMEFIEKAKYELIMAIKNEECAEVITVLRQYYTDMVKIVCGNTDIIHNTCSKYVLFFQNNSESFIFSNETKLLEFYEKYKIKDQEVGILEIHNIDPENNFRPNTQIHIDTWMKNKNNLN